MELCNSEPSALSTNEVDLVIGEVQVTSPQCLACKTAFRAVKKLVRSHISNEKLKSAMNKACNMLGKVANKCHRVVNSHGDLLARFARNPRVLCSMLTMCLPIGEDLEEYEAYQELVSASKDSEELESSTDVDLVT